MPDVVMTNHSVKRTKERIGLSKKIADKNAQRALEYGITHSEAKGGLCRYLDKLYLSNGNANAFKKLFNDIDSSPYLVELEYEDHTDVGSALEHDILPNCDFTVRRFSHH